MLIFVVLINSTSLFANWKSEREDLDKVYKIDKFRVFYTLNGKNKLKDKTDTNKNNIPDIVENIALQLDTANKLFSNVLGFKQPFFSERYKNNVQYIDIHLLSLKYSGESGDGVIQYNYKIIKQNTKTLSIAISNTIKAENLTPLHELFHAYQNGYSMFKNRWYTEGTARWSEFSFKKRTGKQHNLPSTAKQIEKLLNRSYGAKYFWNRLLFLCATNDKGFKLPKNLKNRVYIGTNKKIIEDNTLFGYKFLEKFLAKLDIYDDIATKKRGFINYNWREKEQKSFQNNPYILKALKDTIVESKCKKSKEINGFINGINEYLNMKKQTVLLTI